MHTAMGSEKAPKMNVARIFIAASIFGIAKLLINLARATWETD
jgi:hypothetical protein